MTAKVAPDTDRDEAPASPAWRKVHSSQGNRDLREIETRLEELEGLIEAFLGDHLAGECRCDFCAGHGWDTQWILEDMVGIRWQLGVALTHVHGYSVPPPPPTDDERANRLLAERDRIAAELARLGREDPAADEPAVVVTTH